MQSRITLLKCGRFLSTSAASPRVTVDMVGADKNIAAVTLNRPEKLNALDMNMFRAVRDVAEDLADDKKIRAVILSGSGKGFCAGLDVKSVASSPVSSVGELLRKPGASEHSCLAQDVGYSWRKLRVPVIAALHGVCFGGGLQIALGADIRIASPACKLSVMEAKWGLIPDMSLTVTLRDLVRIDVAKELTMTGRVFEGDEALRMGVVTKLADDPYEEALKLAEQIVGRSPDSVACAKELLQRTWHASEQECLEVETELQKQLLASWNQLAASARAFGASFVPYKARSS